MVWICVLARLFLMQIFFLINLCFFVYYPHHMPWVSIFSGTALHVACETGSVDCIDFLLDSGANIEALREVAMQTPLSRASQYGHVGAVKRLLQAGAAINRQTEECSNALTMACHFGHSSVVRVLLGKDTISYDVITQKRFPHYWSALLVRMWSLDVFCDLSMNNLLNKQSICLWFETRDVHVTSLKCCAPYSMYSPV